MPYVAAIPGQGLPMENNVFLSANYGWAFYVANGPMLDNDTYNQNERWSQLPRRWYASGRPYRQIDQVDGTPNPGCSAGSITRPTMPTGRRWSPMAISSTISASRC